MKIAIAGKGGVGKTSIAGTLARHMARDGNRVFAFDNDLNPNLSLTVGIPAERLVDLPTLPRDVITRFPDKTAEWKIHPHEIYSTYGLQAPDGITLVVAAEPKKANTGCFGMMHLAMRDLVYATANAPGEVCILDTEASTEHLCIGTAMYVDVMYAVVEPYFKSLETGRRVLALARDLGIPRVGMIANKIRVEREVTDVATFAEHHDLELAGWVPHDNCFIGAERAALAPIDFAPGAPAINAIRELGRAILAADDPSLPARRPLVAQ